MSTSYRPLREDDVADVVRIRTHAFGTPVDAELPEIAEYRGLFAGGRLRAVLRLRATEQYLGGRPVPCTLVSSVAVDLGARGRGLGGRLLRAALAEMADAGSVVSLLHPTVVGAYRSVGYELAGSRIRYQVPVHDLPRAPGGGGCELTTERPDDAALDDCHDRFARGCQGPLRRGTSPGAPYWLAAWHGNRLTAYLNYRHVADPGSTKGEEAAYRFGIESDEFVWIDAGSAQLLLAAIGTQAPLATTFCWLGQPADPLLTLFPAGRPHVETEQRWMARIVDVRRALGDATWPATADADVTLTVTDPVLGDGAYHLSAPDGRVRSTQVDTGRGEVTVDVGGLAALLTSWLTPTDLTRLGRLHGAPESLAAVFAGPRPFLFDWF